MSFPPDPFHSVHNAHRTLEASCLLLKIKYFSICIQIIFIALHKKKKKLLDSNEKIMCEMRRAGNGRFVSVKKSVVSLYSHLKCLHNVICNRFKFKFGMCCY